MNIIIYDEHAVWADLLAITFTRPVGAIRLGIDTIAEKWQALLPGEYSWKAAESYLDELFPTGICDDDTLYVSGCVVPDAGLASRVADLGRGEALVDARGRVVAHRGCDYSVRVESYTEVTAVEQLYDIFMFNAAQIAADFSRFTAGRVSQPLSDTNTVIGDQSLIFVEDGARVEGAFLNTSHGPIYIGRDAEVMEGSMLRGPIALCEHATVNMGTKIYPGTTIGPYCKVGGEINNVVFQGYSNKAHDGFLGNAVIGEWCNIGAGSVASNLKNDYTPIRLWNYPTRRFARTSLQFCGLIMGDHSKAGINTMFNTATVLGVGVNVHGAGFPRNFVESFSEGSTSGFTRVPEKKFFDIAERMMSRRGRALTPADRRMLTTLYAGN